MKKLFNNNGRASLFNKKGQSDVFGQLIGLAIGIATVAITLIVVFLILSNTGANSQVVADANATAAVNTMTDAAADIPDWVPLIVITVIGSILIGLVAFFGVRRK